MKIAIQGHKTRGKEVIQILESLGGENWWHQSGDLMKYYYYFPATCIVKSQNPEGYKLYNLEEFEKEFPFKIGDKVIVKGCHTPHKIIALEPFNKSLCYKASNGFHYRPEYLELYKEMKEERNITLTLEKAKEWYEKGGELREIALQAFKESELNPKKWVDLGLPSGTLWCNINEEGYFSWDKMKESFSVENLPKLTDFAELYDYCDWEWDDKKKGMWVIGINGNRIFMSASGYPTSMVSHSTVSVPMAIIGPVPLIWVMAFTLTAWASIATVMSILQAAAIERTVILSI